ncbi:MAG: hypothetical protein QGH06_03710 [Lutibacter sp.]|nr:hypothetical protein [Lutibacter sp.]
MAAFTTSCEEITNRPAQKPLTVIDWPETPMPLWEVILLKPKTESIEAFVANVKAHNEKYHQVEGMSTTLRYYSSGKHAGFYSWAEGPMQMDYLDNKEMLEGHQEDWMNNVMPLVAEEGPANMYRFITPLSNMTIDPSSNPSKILEVQQFSVKKGSRKTVNDLLNNYRHAAQFPVPYAVIVPTQDNGDHVDFALVWHYDSFGAMDGAWEGYSANKMLDSVYGKRVRKKMWDDWQENVTLVGSYVAQSVD